MTTKTLNWDGMFRTLIETIEVDPTLFSSYESAWICGQSHYRSARRSASKRRHVWSDDERRVLLTIYEQRVQLKLRPKPRATASDDVI